LKSGKEKSKEHKKAILNGVHDALVEAVKIPDHDRLQGYMNLMKIVLKHQNLKPVT